MELFEVPTHFIAATSHKFLQAGGECETQMIAYGVKRMVFLTGSLAKIDIQDVCLRFRDETMVIIGILIIFWSLTLGFYRLIRV